MRIIGLKTTPITIPFKKPTLWPYGIWKGVSVVIIELFTDEGIVGYGESLCRLRPVSAVKELVQAAKPLLVGENPFNIERLIKKMEGFGGWVLARHMAAAVLSGIEMALWDIAGKKCNQPLYNLIGGKVRDEIPFFYYIPHSDPDFMAQKAESAVKEGRSTLYCKYASLEDLEDCLSAIRKKVGYNPKVWVDFNQTLSPGYAVSYIREMEKYRIDIVEQPVLATDLEGMAYVKESISGRLLAHESCITFYELLQVVKKSAADILSVEPRMTWGIAGSKKAAGIAEAAGLPVVLHSSGELGLAQAAFLHLAASTPNFILPNQGIYDWFDDDYIRGGKMEFQGECLPVPRGPGLGVVPDPEKISQYHEEYKRTGGYTPYQAEVGIDTKISLWPSY